MVTDVDCLELITYNKLRDPVCGFDSLKQFLGTILFSPY